MTSTRTAEAFAHAFDLGNPMEPLAFVQHTVSRTWRLTTDTGTYLAKELWPGDDPHWTGQLADRMAFELQALEAGIRMPTPMPPVESAYGWAGRMDGTGAYRVYGWMPGRHPHAGDDLTDWLAATLAALHQLRPAGSAIHADWRWDGLVDEATWDRLLEAATDQHKPWAGTLGQRLIPITTLTARLWDAWRAAADDTITHRDFEPTNVLLTPDGPALIDWDSVGYASTTLEAGCVAVSFSGDDPRRIQRLLEAYHHGGGQLADLGGDMLLQPIARGLSDLRAKITIALRERASHRDRLDPAALDQTLAQAIDDLLEETARLTAIGRSLNLGQS